jgi:hypothetical protein
MTTQWQKEDKMAKRGQNGKQHNGKKRKNGKQRSTKRYNEN